VVPLVDLDRPQGRGTALVGDHSALLQGSHGQLLHFAVAGVVCDPLSFDDLEQRLELAVEEADHVAALEELPCLQLIHQYIPWHTAARAAAGPLQIWRRKKPDANAGGF